MEFRQFTANYGFKHVTSSPYYPQSNGCAERTVKTVKSLLEHSNDPYFALLTYRATPLPWCGYSPAELLMGRKLQANLPMITENIRPDWGSLRKFREMDVDFKQKQKEDYDKRHRVRPLSSIPDDTEVWITSRENAREEPVTGRVSGTGNTPRSYNVNTEGGQVCRNRIHLNICPSTPTTKHSEFSSEKNDDESDYWPSKIPPVMSLPSQRSPVMTRSRSGTAIHPPERLQY